ncbi:hypothetical protein [Microvirga puerhi]|uniref:Flagellar FliJ protein n=1 Tax=Microvirga puerhi TaxID=2876078 RepID=A0ABS7VW98_9HYPH|nr:hypothetical protein [Microvirga puerhi]MBZ6079335.1 hypothetical protein [Microvirga puerhi]
MQKRLQKTKRLLKLQQKLHEIEKWKLAGLQQRIIEVQDAQATLITTLNDDDALHGLFVEARAKRLQSLSVEEVRIKQAQEQQSKVALDKAMKVKRTERLVDRLNVEHRRHDEKKDYLSLLDVLASKTDASLP